ASFGPFNFEATNPITFSLLRRMDPDWHLNAAVLVAQDKSSRSNDHSGTSKWQRGQRFPPKTRGISLHSLRPAGRIYWSGPRRAIEHVDPHLIPTVGSGLFAVHC